LGERKLLNFGHTLGHALENSYELSHGQAISIGMIYASKISHQHTGFKDAARIAKVLEAYGLPVSFEFDVKKVMSVLKKDKKRERKTINYILLNKIGEAIIQPIPLAELEKFIQAYKK